MSEAAIPFEQLTHEISIAVSPDETSRPALYEIPDEPEEVIVQKLADAVTDIKTDFQSLEWKRGPERDSLSRTMARQGVAKIFIALGALDADDKDQLEDFQKAYTRAEEVAADLDGEALSELFDHYEDHPSLRALRMLEGTTKNVQTEIVGMRRTTLVLLADSEPGAAND
jgi:hypothetical protein